MATWRVLMSTMLVLVVAVGMAQAQAGDPVGGSGADPVGGPVGDPGGDPEGDPVGEPHGDPGGDPTGDPSGDPEGDPVGEPGQGDPVGGPSDDPVPLPGGDPSGDPVGGQDGDPAGGSGEGQPVGGPGGSPVPVPVPKLPSAMVNGATITFSGIADTGGDVSILVASSTGLVHEARVAVTAGMGGDGVAHELARALRDVLARDLDIQESGVVLRIRGRALDPPVTFTVRVTDWSVFDLGFVVRRQ